MVPQNRTPGFAMVTGGSHRVGKIFVMELSRLGYDIILHYHTAREQADETAREINKLGKQVICLQADLCDASQIKAMFDEIANRKIPFQILVNSAAVMKGDHILNVSLADWQTTLDMNLRAPFLCTRAAVEVMQPGGMVVNVCDEFAHQTWKAYPVYGISKSALEHLTRVMASALAPRIRVNGLALGPVLPPDRFPARLWDKIVRRSKMEQPILPDWIRHTLDYLIKNEYISGEILHPYDIVHKKLI